MLWQGLTQRGFEDAMKFGWEDIIVWPSAARKQSRTGGGRGGAGARRPETDGAAREPREVNAAHSQGDKLEDDTSHSTTKGGEHLTGTLR